MELLFLLGLVVYFIPSLVAASRKHATAIVALNLLLGWTVIGWVGALVWALADPIAGQGPVPVQAPPAPQPDGFCRVCGVAREPGHKFCHECGAVALYEPS